MCLRKVLRTVPPPRTRVSVPPSSPALRDLRVKTDARQTLATRLDSVDFRVIPWPQYPINFRKTGRPVWRWRWRVNIAIVLAELRPLRLGIGEGVELTFVFRFK
jgi:hypothetical protein